MAKDTKVEREAPASGISQPKTSWADVVEASARADSENVQASNASESNSKSCSDAPAGPFEHEPLRPGDIVRHEKFGDCTVHRIAGNPKFVHMARPNEKVRRLSLDIVEFEFLAIEGRYRIFSMKMKTS